jgi:hypothetical protein
MYFVEGGWNNKLTAEVTVFLLSSIWTRLHLNGRRFFTNDDVIFSQPSPLLYSIDKYVSIHTLQSHRDTARTWKVNFEYAEKSSLEHSTSYEPHTGWWQTDKPLCVSITKCYKEPWTSPRLVDMINVRVSWKVGNFLGEFLVKSGQISLLSFWNTSELKCLAVSLHSQFWYKAIDPFLWDLAWQKSRTKNRIRSEKNLVRRANLRLHNGRCNRGCLCEVHIVQTAFTCSSIAFSQFVFKK